MTETRRIIHAIAGNMGTYVVNILVALVLSPYVVRTLGDTQYGVWTVVVSVIGYYGLFDLGIKTSFRIFMTREWARRDVGAVSGVVASAFALLLAIAIFAGLLSLLVAFGLGEWIAIPADQLDAARLAFVILAAGTLVGLPLGIYALIPVACQRFDIVNAISIASRLVSALGIWFALAHGFGIVGMAIVQAGVAVGVFFAWIPASLRILPEVRLQRERVSRSVARELVTSGWHLFVGRFAGQVIQWADPIVIALVLDDPIAVTYYAIGGNLVPYYRDALLTIGNALGSYTVAWQTRGEVDKIRNLLTTGTRWVGGLSAVGAGGLLFLGEDFLRLWMGADYVTGDRYVSSATILVVLGVAALVRNMMTGVQETLIGRADVVILSRLGFWEALANLVLSVALCRWIGILGVALGTLIPAVFVRGVIAPLAVLSRTGLGWRDFYAEALRGPLVVLPAMGLGAWAVRQWLVIDRLSVLVIAAFLVALIGFVAMFFLSLTRDERTHVRDAARKRIQKL